MLGLCKARSTRCNFEAISCTQPCVARLKWFHGRSHDAAVLQKFLVSKFQISRLSNKNIYRELFCYHILNIEDSYDNCRKTFLGKPTTVELQLSEPDSDMRKFG